MPTPSIKPSHKAIQTYYRTMDEYRAGQISHEGVTETAFSQLLSETARPHGWMLVPKLSFKRGGKTIIPDGTLRDLFSLHRGYWEAKDTDDNLFAEIRKKKDKGYRVEKMKLTKDKKSLIVNPSLTLEGIPPEVFEYRLGNRSALDWVIDQYQISEDKRSGIVSDPNREDDPEYIVRLVGQVIRVSVETVKIVKSLPPFQ